jgi:hypothetical protein
MPLGKAFLGMAMKKSSSGLVFKILTGSILVVTTYGGNCILVLV